MLSISNIMHPSDYNTEFEKLREILDHVMSASYLTFTALFSDYR